MISCGEFDPNHPEFAHESARAKLVNWSNTLPRTCSGATATKLVHGYSGVWKVEVIYSVWRGNQMEGEQYARYVGKAHLQVPAITRNDPTEGTGMNLGQFKVKAHLKGEVREAEFNCSEWWEKVVVHPSGEMFIERSIVSRERIYVEPKPEEGEAPIDGLEQQLEDKRDFEIQLVPDLNEWGALSGSYQINRRDQNGLNITSRATIVLTREDAIRPVEMVRAGR
ncbi:MAG: hypothetical protein AAF585_18930 [Verrucomicrobiota bacterium]